MQITLAIQSGQKQKEKHATLKKNEIHKKYFKANEGGNKMRFFFSLIPQKKNRQKEKNKHLLQDFASDPQRHKLI